MTVERADDIWLKLQQVWQWIDTRYKEHQRLSAGWVHSDKNLARALATGLIRARGFSSSMTLELIRFTTDPSALTVHSVLGELRVSRKDPTMGAMLAFARQETFKDVELSEYDLASYVANLLGPGMREPDPPTGRQGPRQSPKIDNVRTVAASVFPDGVPVNYPRGKAVQEIVVALEAQEKADGGSHQVSEDTIRRALGFRT